MKVACYHTSSAVASTTQTISCEWLALEASTSHVIRGAPIFMQPGDTNSAPFVTLGSLAGLTTAGPGSILIARSRGES
jgi:hypothetical protein